MHRWGRGQGAPPSLPQVPVKVEPKTYLANERTFLHWLSISSLVGMMALAILRRREGLDQVTMAVGATSFLSSVLYMLYALVTYLHRAKKISAGQPIQFENNRGPVVLTLMLVCVVVFGSANSLGWLRGNPA